MPLCVASPRALRKTPPQSEQSHFSSMLFVLFLDRKDKKSLIESSRCCSLFQLSFFIFRFFFPGISVSVDTCSAHTVSSKITPAFCLMLQTVMANSSPLLQSNHVRSLLRKTGIELFLCKPCARPKDALEAFHAALLKTKIPNVEERFGSCLSLFALTHQLLSSLSSLRHYPSLPVACRFIFCPRSFQFELSVRLS